MTRKWLRWIPAAAVPAVIAAAALAGSLPASAGDPLPAKTPQEVLALVAQHAAPSLSGTLEQTSQLGLPQLPKTGPSAGSDAASALELLSGPHTARVFMDGSSNMRVQVLDRLAERNAVRSGDQVWLYSSKDNTATHLELTMVHEAMVLEYSGRHLAVIELAASLKLLLYVSLIACAFVPWGLAPAGAGPAAHAVGTVTYVAKLMVAGLLLALFETAVAKMRVFRVPEFVGAGLMLALLGTLLLFVSQGRLR